MRVFSPRQNARTQWNRRWLSNLYTRIMYIYRGEKGANYNWALAADGPPYDNNNNKYKLLRDVNDIFIWNGNRERRRDYARFVPSSRATGRLTIVVSRKSARTTCQKYKKTKRVTADRLCIVAGERNNNETKNDKKSPRAEFYNNIVYFILLADTRSLFGVQGHRNKFKLDREFRIETRQKNKNKTFSFFFFFIVFLRHLNFSRTSYSKCYCVRACTERFINSDHSIFRPITEIQL